MKQRGVDFAECDGARNRLAGDAIARAHDLAGLHSPSGQQRKVDLRPMIAAGLVTDFRSAAELAPNDDGTFLIESIADRRDDGTP